MNVATVVSTYRTCLAKISVDNGKADDISPQGRDDPTQSEHS